MDQYDEEQDSGNLVQGIFGSGNPGMSYYRSNLEDPYITLRNTAGVSDSEADDNELRDTDYVILAARNEDDVSHLEVEYMPGFRSKPTHNREALYVSCFQRNTCAG